MVCNCEILNVPMIKCSKFQCLNFSCSRTFNFSNFKNLQNQSCQSSNFLISIFSDFQISKFHVFTLLECFFQYFNISNVQFPKFQISISLKFAFLANFKMFSVPMIMFSNFQFLKLSSIRTFKFAAVQRSSKADLPIFKFSNFRIFKLSILNIQILCFHTF